MNDKNKHGQTIEGEVVSGSASEKVTSAIALHYNGEDAPQVTAKGHNEVAQQIYQIARENNVPLHEDADLANLLSRLDIGEEIPRNLYIAVAEVIAFAYLVNGKAEQWVKNNQ